MAVTPKGVRMINENVVQTGRAFVITDPSQADWANIPDGSLYINPEDGTIQVKLKGEKTWSPTGLKDDGTIVISRDTSLRVETFTIISIDEANKQFTYEDGEGNRYTKTKDEKGFVFELPQPRTQEEVWGSYLPGRNHLMVVLDDVLERSQASGGVEEIDEHRFRITEDLPVGTEVTVKYIHWVRIGNPYPRIYESQTLKNYKPDPVTDTSVVDGEEKEPRDAEVGDLFLDWNATLDGLDDLSVDELTELEIHWNQIIGTPKTLSGYGITDAAYKGHKHSVNDINGLQQALENAFPNEINAAKLQGLVPDTGRSGKANTIAVYDANGKLPVNALPPQGRFEVGMIIDWFGASNKVPKGWAICDGTTKNGIATPDLRGKFIIGGGTSGNYLGCATKANTTASNKKYNGGKESQSVSIGTANLPPHAHAHGSLKTSAKGSFHTFKVDPKADGKIFTSKQVPDSQRNGYSNSKDGGEDREFIISMNIATELTGSTGSVGSGTAINVSTMPPYVALFKIMFVGV